ncbi:hypothetical protein A3I53_03090 [Candidatus Curtissbacteria bacterium RIFCSPLOWO2_02_FULL_40_13b]|uniref:HTH luxR-type domain-containing protein n=4 Tax=Candidatus Curtissiibacteriota TaxID=1752717 RepID=A0A1F5HQX0_9BACT|nr:MAG: hypothetical protein A3I53_03090 [Candidatus Curtissbacteria bacterium RIFCSPLOWO2_02_FULL_40_13b]
MYRYIDTMSQVSKRVLTKQIENRLFQNFWELIADIKKPRDVQTFLEDFLSPTEKVMLAKRMAIVILLTKGYSHRSIASMLKVSTSTVTKFVLFLKIKSSGFQLLIQKYSKKQAFIEMVQELERYLYRLQPRQHFVEEGLIKAKLGHKKEVF